MGGDSRAGSRQRPGLELKLTSASCLLQIIDEADRMIDSMHQSWLPRVVAAAFPSEGPRDPCAVLQRTQPRVVTAARYLALSLLCFRPSGAALSWSLEPSTPGWRACWLGCSCFSSTPFPFSMCCPQMPLQKLLFSATLTQNPEKLQQLGLYQPRLFSTGSAHRGSSDPDIDMDGDSGGKYTFPAGLTVSRALGVERGCI